MWESPKHCPSSARLASAAAVADSKSTKAQCERRIMLWPVTRPYLRKAASSSFSSTSGPSCEQRPSLHTLQELSSVQTFWPDKDFMLQSMSGCKLKHMAGVKGCRALPDAVADTSAIAGVKGPANMAGETKGHRTVRLLNGYHG